MFSLKVGSGSIGNITKLGANLDAKFSNAILKLGAQGFATAFPTYAEAIEDIFAAEGPGWDDLARGTQEEREATGFPPRHPILQRTGTLKRSLTDPSFGPQEHTVMSFDPMAYVTGGEEIFGVQVHVGNVVEGNAIGQNDTEWTFTVVDERFEKLQDGAQSNVPGGTSIPARPMLPRGTQEKMVAQQIGADLYALLVKLLA